MLRARWTRKESTCSFSVRRLMMWYAHRRRGPGSAGHPIRGAAASSERASAAVGAGDRGPATRSRRGAGGHGGRRSQCDHRAPRGAELEAGEDPLPVRRARRPGGGRKPATAVDPDLVSALLALVEPDERGDPISPLRWTTKSLRHLAEELSRQGHPVSAPTVGRLLRENCFSLQGTAKTLEGEQHPDRDAQFRYINAVSYTHL